VLANHVSRIGATEAALMGPDFRLLGRAGGKGLDLSTLAAQLAGQAAVTGHGSSVALLGARPYQAVLVPVKAPLLIGWVLMAFPLDEQFADDFRNLSGLDLTLLAQEGGGAWQVAGSSLAAAHARELGTRATAEARTHGEAMATVMVQGEQLGVRLAPLQSLRTGGYTGGMLPLDDLIAKHGFDTSDFDKSIMAGLASGGKQYALPYDFGSLVVTYNKDMFQAAGVAAPKIGWTMADFESAAKALTRNGKYGFAAYPVDLYMFPMLLSRTRNCCCDPLVTSPRAESAMKPPLANCGPAVQ